MTMCTKCGLSFFGRACTVDTMGRHHSYDDKPSKLLNIWGKEHLQWHFQDELHREHAPAITIKTVRARYKNYKPTDHMDYTWYYHGRHVIQVEEDSLCVKQTIVLKDCAGVVLSQVNDIFWEALVGNKKQLIKLL